MPPTTADVPPELAGLQGYEIVKELGRGGMGVVYLARNRLMDRFEVLKVMNKSLVGHAAAIERFLREIRSAARLNPPPTSPPPTKRYHHQLDDLLVLAMEYVEGEDLAKVVKARGPLPVAHACFCVHHAALALQRGHELGLVHRDIKPGNILLAKQGKRPVVKVIDFGLAKAKSEVTHDQALTPTNAMIGTPPVTPPPGATPGREERGHAVRHLQPRLHAVLPTVRSPAVSGADDVRGAARPAGRSAAAATGSAAQGAGGARGGGGQDDGREAARAAAGQPRRLWRRRASCASSKAARRPGRTRQRPEPSPTRRAGRPGEMQGRALRTPGFAVLSAQGGTGWRC